MSSPKLRPPLWIVSLQFVGIILGLLSIRWFLFEPFTVPSGSMFPSLRVNDYIVVNKLDAGLKIPILNQWVIGPKIPKRGQVVVFRSVKSQAYFVKRLMGIPGDIIKMKGHEVIEINGQKVTTEPVPEIWSKLRKDFVYEDSVGVTAFKEDYSNVKDMGLKSATLMYSKPENPKKEEEIDIFEVPKDQLFFMGDHRSSSSDSRAWGFVNVEDLVGPVSFILFSCQEKNPNTQFCDLKTIRWDRVLTKFKP